MGQIIQLVVNNVGLGVLVLIIYAFGYSSGYMKGSPNITGWGVRGYGGLTFVMLIFLGVLIYLGWDRFVALLVRCAA